MLFENPLELRRREIRVDHEAGERGDAVAAPFAQLGAAGGRAAILPDDRAVDRTTGVAIPDDRGLALVGDADAHGLGAGAGDRLARGGERRVEDLIGIVLDPAGLRKELRDLAIAARRDVAVLAHHQAGDAGGSGVNRENVTHGSRTVAGECRGR